MFSLVFCHPFSQPQGLSALLFAELPPPGDPQETCAPQAARGAGTGLGQHGTAPGLPKVSHLAKQFPAELTWPWDTWQPLCHLCLQTTQPHHAGQPWVLGGMGVQMQLHPMGEG